MTHEGRQILYRVGLWCSREWGHALARQMSVVFARQMARIEVVDLPDWKAPFEVETWHDALEIVDDLRNGRSVKEKYQNGKPTK